MAPDGAGLRPSRRDPADPADPVDSFYVRSLIRSQLRLALSVAIGFLVLLVGLAVLVGTWPEINASRIATVPLPWLVMGLGVYPIILLGAFLFTRAAQRNEDRYRDVSGR